MPVISHTADNGHDLFLSVFNKYSVLIRKKPLSAKQTALPTGDLKTGFLDSKMDLCYNERKRCHVRKEWISWNK